MEQKKGKRAVNIKLPSETYELLRTIADAEYRKPGNMAAVIVEREVNRIAGGRNGQA